MRKFKLIAPLALIALLSLNATAAPNYLLAEGTTACKHLKTLSIVARIKKDEYVPDMQRSEASNDCTLPMKEDKPVTAFDIGVTAKVEFFALGKLDVYYVNERDLISLSEDNPKR